MRSWRSETLNFALVLSVPVGIASILPYGALSFRAQTPAETRAETAALVALSPEQEQLAIRAARTSSRGSEGDVRGLRADLSVDELPDDVRQPVLSISARTRPPQIPDVPRGLVPFLPSQRAPDPVRIKADGHDGSEAAFPREELLQIN